MGTKEFMSSSKRKGSMKICHGSVGDKERVSFLLTWVAITKYHRLGDLNNRNIIFFFSSGGYKFNQDVVLVGFW